MICCSSIIFFPPNGLLGVVTEVFFACGGLRDSYGGFDRLNGEKDLGLEFLITATVEKTGKSRWIRAEKRVVY